MGIGHRVQIVAARVTARTPALNGACVESDHLARALQASARGDRFVQCREGHRPRPRFVSSSASSQMARTS
jgi:hypothetical protein